MLPTHSLGHGLQSFERFFGSVQRLLHVVADVLFSDQFLEFGMSQKDLDYLLDEKTNTIGALLMHLAATDRTYQINTFEGNSLRELPASYQEKWAVAMELGEPARKAIKGNSLDYYLNLLSETREHTLAEFRKRDDAWLMTVDKECVRA